MIRMDDAPWGIRIAMQGQPSRQDLSKLLDDLRKALPSPRPFFGAILDLSGTGPANPELRDLLLQVQRLLQSKGMVRLAIGVANALTAAQMRRLATETGVAPGVRCIDTRIEGWASVAEHWAVSGREPEPATLLAAGNS